jgi:hypothetical protein
LQDNLTAKQNDYAVLVLGDSGGFQIAKITVDSGVAVYNYILPAQSK